VYKTDRFPIDRFGDVCTAKRALPPATVYNSAGSWPETVDCIFFFRARIDEIF